MFTSRLNHRDVTSTLSEALIRIHRDLTQAVDQNETTEDIIGAVADTAAFALRATGWWTSFRKPFITIEGETFWFRPDIYILAINATDNYNRGLIFTSRQDKWVDRIEDVMFFDKSQQTCSCSTMPTYCMYAVEARVVTRDGCPDDIRESAREALLNAGEKEYDVYRNAAIIDTFIAENVNNGMVHHYGNPEVDFNEMDGTTDDEKYGIMISELREHFRGNSLI